MAALLGADVILTDLTDRLRLLQKNVDENVHSLSTCGSASVRELTWGETLDDEVVEPLPDFGAASFSLSTSFLLKYCIIHISWFLCDFFFCFQRQVSFPEDFFCFSVSSTGHRTLVYGVEVLSFPILSSISLLLFFVILHCHFLYLFFSLDCLFL